MVFIKTLFSGKKIWLFIALGVIILGIWGSMKYDNNLIRDLQKDLTDTQVERDSAVIDNKISEEVREIDDTVLKDQLEDQETIDDETDQAIRDIDKEIGDLLIEIDDQIEDEPSINKNDTPSEVTNDVGDNVNVKEKQHEKESGRTTTTISSRVARSVVDGMWNYYCNSVEDKANCSE